MVSIKKYMNTKPVFSHKNTTSTFDEVQAKLTAPGTMMPQKVLGSITEIATAPAKFIIQNSVVQATSNQTRLEIAPFRKTSTNRIGKITTSPAAPRNTRKASMCTMLGCARFCAKLKFHAATLHMTALATTKKAKVAHR